MPNHMPAPWSIDATQRGPVQIKSRHNFAVGTALTLDDARLMAAAPDLLAAVEEALWLLDRVAGWDGDGEPITKFAARLHGDTMRVAIAKAEGRTDGR